MLLFTRFKLSRTGTYFFEVETQLSILVAVYKAFQVAGDGTGYAILPKGTRFQKLIKVR